MNRRKYLIVAVFVAVAISFALVFPPGKTSPPVQHNVLLDSLYVIKDTNRVVYNQDGQSFRFHQYQKMLNSGDYTLSKNISPPNFGVVIKRKTEMERKMDSLIAQGNFGTNLNQRVEYILSLSDKVLVEKSRHELYLIRDRKVIFKFPVGFGKNPIGHKQQEGDGRTPEGTYVLDWRKFDKVAFYKTFHISYPNENDVRSAQQRGVPPGENVMIHGSPEKPKHKDWTNGCIGMANKDLDTLFKYVTNGTVIEIRK